MKIISGILSLFILLGCSSPNAQKDINKKDYRLIKDNLYIDKKGNLYLKTIDQSKAETRDPEKRKKLTEDRWLDAVYCDNCQMSTSNESIEGMAYLKDIIDTNTFKLKYTDNEQGGDFYEDKNHTYFHKWMVDGGTISVFEK